MVLTESPPPDPEEHETCAACGRDLWAFGPPALDGDAWICGECDAARNFDALDF